MSGELEGVPAKAHVSRSAPAPPSVGRSWLASFGPLLFIPIFVAIVVILFWVNKRPQPIGGTGSTAAAPGAPNMAMQKVHDTLERLNKNLEANPRDVVSMDSLAIMYSIAGSYEKASKFYERHLKIEPDNKDVKIALGLTYKNLNKTDEAIALIKDVLDKEPTYAFGLYYLGEIYSSSGKKEEAVANWQKIVHTYPGTEIANMAQKRIHEVQNADSSTLN
ncbi:MAG: tetratricopeptide repeat protein [bacterium]